MTFSILARDPGTGALGGAAATGSLCVGGWVLRGDSRAGISASQGAAPSTMWGEDVIEALRAGASAAEAVARITGADSGRDWRQLSALGRTGAGAAFTGERNTGWYGQRTAPGHVVAGNMLAGPEVLETAERALVTTDAPFPDRLLDALQAGARAGGDTRGLQSAAILIVSDTDPPLTLRIDWAEDPLPALADLLARTRAPGYGDWLPRVPTRRDPERHDVRR